MRFADEVVLDRRPVVAVGRVDRHGAEAQPVRRLDLVAHQAEQRAHDQRGAVALVAPHARGDPVDEALAPARPLHDERARAVPDDRLDRLALALAERRARAEHRLEVGLEGVRRGGLDIEGHVGSIRLVVAHPVPGPTPGPAPRPPRAQQGVGRCYGRVSGRSRRSTPGFIRRRACDRTTESLPRCAWSVTGP